jgi:hypothetical protein
MPPDARAQAIGVGFSVGGDAAIGEARDLGGEVADELTVAVRDDQIREHERRKIFHEIHGREQGIEAFRIADVGDAQHVGFGPGMAPGARRRLNPRTRGQYGERQKNPNPAHARAFFAQGLVRAIAACGSAGLRALASAKRARRAYSGASASYVATYSA